MTAAAADGALLERAPRAAASPHVLNFSWLLKLRWVAVLGQVLTTLFARWALDLELPMGPLFAVIGVALGSNVLFTLWRRRPERIGDWTIGSVMVLDVLLLTALLVLAGGPSNPFTSLYFVHVSLGAMVLSPRWTATLIAASAICFGVLYVGPGIETSLALDAALSRARGGAHWLGFVLAASVAGYFVNRVQRALHERERELDATRAAQARSDKLASLATLSAGAAHELSTPLSTIAVAAKELERNVERGAPKDSMVEDTRLIREQVARCRHILTDMAAEAGQSLGELAAPLTARALLELTLARLEGIRADARARVQLLPSTGLDERILRVPPNATAQALTGLVKNALDAGGPVELALEEERGAIAIRISDRGRGMPPEVLARVGEPFFTTKEPGRGMGLGVFLARAVAERLGGGLELRSELGEGTTARVRIPTDPEAPPPPGPSLVSRAVNAVSRAPMRAGSKR